MSSHLYSSIYMNMADKVYRAVIADNEEGGYKYHLVGGAAGTVSPSE